MPHYNYGMKNERRQPNMRDRTYKQTIGGDYLSDKQYVVVAIALLMTHILLELFYLWLGCIPMALINIASILIYVVSIIVIVSNKVLVSIWIMVLEVYLHVVCCCIFLGIMCGYQLWLFGTLSCVFLPFFLPGLNGFQKKQIGIFSVVIVGTFMILTTLGRYNLLPTNYNASPEVASVLYYVNAFLGFSAIMFYAAAYNSRMSEKNMELQMAAEHDFLTGIYNRQRMQKILDAEILRAQELDENHLMVAIADIDFFKKINDTYGHVAGDEALKELTQVFSRYFDEGLLYGRWGGEEFLLIAPENMTYAEFGSMLEDIRKQVEDNEFMSGNEMIRFTISIGAAEYKKGMTSEQLMNTADDRLYHAKETGRNKVVY